MKKLLSTLLTLSMLLAMLSTGAVYAASDAVQADADALTLDDILSVPSWDGNRLIDNLDLDCVTKGEVNQSPITWSSSNEAVISTTGIVTRGAEDAEVTVTATIGEGDDIASKAFTFVVPAASKSVNGMPIVTASKFEDTFSDAELNTSKYGKATPTSYDSVVEENGKMTLTRSQWTSGEPNIDVKHEYNGSLSTTAEFTLHSTSSYLRIAFVGYNWNGFPLYIHWYPKHNNISIGRGGVETDSAEAGRIPLPQSAKGGKAKFTVTIDAANKTYSVWVNNEVVIASNPYMESNAQKPYMIRFSTITSGWMYGVGSTAIDNLKIYESTPSDALTTLICAEKNINISDSIISGNNKYLTGEFVDLSTVTGSNGAAVSYTVSDTSVISETGKVTRALTDKPVTITATITAGGEQLVKNYSFIVPGKYNKIGKSSLPLIDKDYPVGYTVDARATDYLESYSEENGKISITSIYAANQEPGFKYTYSDNLKGDFVQDFVFSSNSKAMRARILDSNYSNKLHIYYLDNGTLAVSGTETVYHESSFTGKTIKLTLAYSMSTNTVDIYVDGELWLDDFALMAGSYKNIQYVWVSHHCASIMGAWRGGQGTTTFYSLGAYKTVDESAISSIMATDVAYSNGGTAAAGDNTATVTVVAGDSAGERGGMLAYAIYSVENGIKKLVGIDVVSLGLNKFAHKEYTAAINLKEAPANAQQQIFIWGDAGLTPVETSAFPAQ